MTELTVPDRIAKLPTDHRGFHVPWFVEWIDGTPDFRVTSAAKIAIGHRKKLCWLCGEPIGTFKAFVIGPMCAVNRTTAEPPSHRECAEYAVRTCPFLSRPKMRRNEKGIDQFVPPSGDMIKRNPGATLIWITKSYRPFRVHNGWLFEVGEPVETLWFAEGRAATRAEVEASINSGVPLLRGPAEAEGAEALAAFERMLAAAQRYLPAA